MHDDHRYHPDPTSARQRRSRPAAHVGGWPTATFLTEVVARVKPLLAPELREVQTRQRWALAQLYYHAPAIHYEVWVRRRTGRVEIGLHFESDRTTNAALLRHFEDYLILIKAELGGRFEVEPWDRGWARVYTTLPAEHLDEPLAERVAGLLAQTITFLQPILDDYQGATP